MILLLISICVILAAVAAILAIKLSSATTRSALLKRQLDEQQTLRDSESRFADIAARVLNDTTSEANKRSRDTISQLISPLREELTNFRKSVDDAYRSEARERFSLAEKIKELVNLNQSLGLQAKELSDALRGNTRVQGDWGEMVLETLLEKSGLRRDIHYTVQTTHDSDGNTLRNDSGHRLRPDVIVYYPDNRCVIIDSKVSLTAYIDLVNAKDSTEAENASRRHIVSIKNHIRELATKRYQDHIGERTTDFIMMFIPNEGAYLSAMNIAPTLWQEAYDSRVIIISPTHLISALRLTEQLWRQDDMRRNTAEIATEAGKMYDKFVGFIDDLGKIDRAIESARTAYDAALGKLSTGRGNLIRRATEMRRLGAKATKEISSDLVAKSTEDTIDATTGNNLPSTASSEDTLPGE